MVPVTYRCDDISASLVAPLISARKPALLLANTFENQPTVGSGVKSRCLCAEANLEIMAHVQLYV